MGFAISYRSTRPVSPAEAEAVERAASLLNQGRTWLGCEPVFLRGDNDGHLQGFSKPNFQPHPDDAAGAAQEGLPDGTTRDLLDILCELSREHGIDWEIGHDHSDGPVGYIRGGVCDPEVRTQIETFADVGEMLLDEWVEDVDGELGDDDEPPILPFRPKGE